MIVLFTDFGVSGPYVGQMKAVLERQAPGIALIDLMHDAPACNPRASAYLLAALCGEFEAGSVFLAVVDPGVGSDRPAVIVEADGRWYVGPGNGLFEIVMRRARNWQWWLITERPERLSASFHGRDLLAPVAARLAAGARAAMNDASVAVELLPESPRAGLEWPDDVGEIIYIDGFGNAITGMRATAIPGDGSIAFEKAGGGTCSLVRARTFSDLPEGTAFWYENANGLAEIAVNSGRADRALGLEIGTPLRIGGNAQEK